MLSPRQGGFALLEILVVMMVIGLLLTVGVVTLLGQRNNVNVRGLQVELDTSAQRLSAFAEQNGLGSRSVETDPNSAITGGFAGLLDEHNRIRLDAVQKIARQGKFVADDLTRTAAADLPTTAIGITISANRRVATARKCRKFFKDGQMMCLLIEINPFEGTRQYSRSYHRGGNAAPAAVFTDAAWGKEPAPSLATPATITPWPNRAIGGPGGSVGGVGAP